MARKKRSSKRPISKATQRAMSRIAITLVERSMFPCLFCNRKESVSVVIDKAKCLGNLRCGNCGEKWESQTHYLTGPIDVYSDWVDASDIVGKTASRSTRIDQARALVLRHRARLPVGVRTARTGPGQASRNNSTRTAPPARAAPGSEEFERRMQEIADAKEAYAIEQREQEIAAEIAANRTQLTESEEARLRNSLTAALGNTKGSGWSGMSPASQPARASNEPTFDRSRFRSGTVSQWANKVARDLENDRFTPSAGELEKLGIYDADLAPDAANVEGYDIEGVSEEE